MTEKLMNSITFPHAGCAGWLHALRHPERSERAVTVFAEKSKYTEARQEKCAPITEFFFSDINKLIVNPLLKIHNTYNNLHLYPLPLQLLKSVCSKKPQILQ